MKCLTGQFVRRSELCGCTGEWRKERSRITSFEYIPFQWVFYKIYKEYSVFVSDFNSLHSIFHRQLIEVFVLMEMNEGIINE